MYFLKTLLKVLSSIYFQAGFALYLFFNMLLIDDQITRLGYSGVIIIIFVVIIVSRQKIFYRKVIKDLNAKSESLLKEKEYYNSFMDSIIDWIWEIDAKGNITYSNNSTQNLLGFDPEDISGKSIFDLMANYEDEGFDAFSKKHNESLKQFKENLNEGVILKNIRLNYKHKNGNLIVTEGMVVPIYSSSTPKNRKILGFRGTSRDITNQLILETNLINNEKRFKSLTEQLPQTILEINEKGTIDFMNKTGYRIFGYDKSEPLKISHLVIDDEQAKLSKLLAKVMNQGGKSVYGEFTALKKSGKKFPMNLYGSPIYIDDRIAGARCIIVDIFGQKEIEKQLKVSLKNLEKAQKKIVELERKNTVEAMGVTANHEMNQPLQVLKSSLSMLEKNSIERPIPPEILHKFVLKMRKSVNMLQTTLDSYKGENAVGYEDYSKDVKMMKFTKNQEIS